MNDLDPVTNFNAQDAMVGRTLRNLAAHQPAALSGAVLDEFPWTGFLPDTDRAEFLAEFLRVVVSAGDLDNFAALGQFLHEWRATAEVHADPVLGSRLAQAIRAEGEPVPAPVT